MRVGIYFICTLPLGSFGRSRPGARIMNKTKIVLAAILVISAAGYLLLPEIRLRLALRGSTIPEPDHPSIIMLGDSHIQFVNWRLLEQCDGIANFGVGGNTTAQMLSRLPDALARKPKLIIVMGGTNDALQKIPADITVLNLSSIQQEVTKRGIEFASLAPPFLHEGLAGSLRVQFTEDDLLADGVHLRRSGYAKIRDAISPLVRKYC
jgi:GDSL-like Lipase/Acylhydrolase family